MLHFQRCLLLPSEESKVTSVVKQEKTIFLKRGTEVIGVSSSKHTDYAFPGRDSEYQGKSNSTRSDGVPVASSLYRKDRSAPGYLNTLIVKSDNLLIFSICSKVADSKSYSKSTAGLGA